MITLDVHTIYPYFQETGMDIKKSLVALRNQVQIAADEEDPLYFWRDVDLELKVLLREVEKYIKHGEERIVPKYNHRYLRFLLDKWQLSELAPEETKIYPCWGTIISALIDSQKAVSLVLKTLYSESTAVAIVQPEVTFLQNLLFYLEAIETI